jgi:leucyl aminopeptidase
MEFIVKEGKAAEFASEALILPLFEGEKQPAAGAQQLDEKLNGFIKEILDDGDFEGKLNQTAVIYTRGAIPAKRIVLAGMGKRAELNPEKLRGAFSKATQQIRELNIKICAAVLDFGALALSDAVLAEAVVEGVYLGLYQFTPFKTLERDKIKELKEFVIIEEQRELIPGMKKTVKTAETICYAVCFVRDIVSTPGNEMTPSDLAREAEAIAAERKKVHVKILDVKEMKELGMNALLSVSGGSCQPPKFIIMEYRGGKRGQAPVVLVGKGLTFDSGGISIKPSEKMDEMKSDMAGGGAVMGTVMAVADLNLPVNLIGLIPATENLPGGRAYKPGDILKSLSGQTIEVLNTDAEGRLILADALAYAGRFQPAAIIDIATLTGACIIALGDNVIGLMGTDDKLKERIKAAAEATDETVWELPLWEEYHELIKSDVADFKNSGGRVAGTITAAAFLSKFAGNYPWAHLDIAGPAWREKGKAYIPKGASGVGVRLFVRLLRNWINESAGKEVKERS